MIKPLLRDHFLNSNFSVLVPYQGRHLDEWSLGNNCYRQSWIWSIFLDEAGIWVHLQVAELCILSLDQELYVLTLSSAETSYASQYSIPFKYDICPRWSHLHPYSMLCYNTAHWWRTLGPSCSINFGFSSTFADPHIIQLLYSSSCSQTHQGILNGV